MAKAKSTASSDTATGVKKKRRRPIFILVPDDIEATNPEAEPQIPPPSPEDSEEKVAALEMPALYHVYLAPPGTGQRDAVRAVLDKHNVDINNIGRIKLFVGDKPFKISTQVRIRF